MCYASFKPQWNLEMRTIFNYAASDAEIEAVNFAQNSNHIYI